MKTTKKKVLLLTASIACATLGTPPALAQYLRGLSKQPPQNQ